MLQHFDRIIANASGNKFMSLKEEVLNSVSVIAARRQVLFIFNSLFISQFRISPLWLPLTNAHIHLHNFLGSRSWVFDRLRNGRNDQALAVLGLKNTLYQKAKARKKEMLKRRKVGETSKYVPSVEDIEEWNKVEEEELRQEAAALLNMPKEARNFGDKTQVN